MINPLEVAILQALWKHDKPSTQEEIRQTIGGEVDELSVVLSGMIKRGMVTQKGSCYRSLLTTSEYCAAEIWELVDQLYGGNAVAFLSNYIDAAGPEGRAALEDAINKGDRPSWPVPFEFYLLRIIIKVHLQ